ncbi:efflux transporter outer membrane subunit [Fulvivirgaceae bacterium PWU5]|uniref:Efflux transporter outer membrane subunit n=1 Tax=Dawidia cretensis TaxID=2782350 RepID=A0AAP2DVZ4_9BACT|nr:efflux transporter outer membrane subunit [Dawidia cretensis]MBT1708398.1 efflux transporter outer membrane subunit [Dawidia cretensis]
MKIKSCYSYIVPALLLFAVSSCKVSNRVLKPANPLPSSFDFAPTTDSLTIAAQPWQVFYGDTCLTALIGAALQNNPDVQIAMENIRIAQSMYAVTRSALFPRMDGAVNARVDRFGEYTMNGVGNDDTNRSETLPEDKKLPDPYPEFFAGVNFSWEANLWGKLSNRRKASLARFMASKEAGHGAVTMLISNVAQYYYALLGLDQEKKVLEQNLQLQEMAFDLVKIQKLGGKVTQLGVDQFESQLLNTRSRLLRVDQQILVTESVLNRLAGQYPKRLPRWTINQYDSVLHVSVGSPDQLIDRRPDLRQAALELHAAGADVAVARAAFYPGLSISAAAGFSAFTVSKWFLAPGSAIYSLGGGLTAPVFQRGRIKALFAAANARQRIALADYQKSLLTAYQEVYAVAHNHYNLDQQIGLKEQEVAVQRRASVNSNDLFSVGYATYLEVITSQRRLLDVELELTNLKKEALQNRAILYRAVGGGWSE